MASFFKKKKCRVDADIYQVPSRAVGQDFRLLPPGFQRGRRPCPRAARRGAGHEAVGVPRKAGIPHVPGEPPTELTTESKFLTLSFLGGRDILSSHELVHSKKAIQHNSEFVLKVTSLP